MFVPHLFIVAHRTATTILIETVFNAISLPISECDLCCGYPAAGFFLFMLPPLNCAIRLSYSTYMPLPCCSLKIKLLIRMVHCKCTLNSCILYSCTHAHTTLPHNTSIGDFFLLFCFGSRIRATHALYSGTANDSYPNSISGNKLVRGKSFPNGNYVKICMISSICLMTNTKTIQAINSSNNNSNADQSNMLYAHKDSISEALVVN